MPTILRFSLSHTVGQTQCQDTSDPGHFGPKTFRHCPDISAEVPKCLTDTLAPRKTLQHWATLAKPWQGGRLCLH